MKQIFNQLKIDIDKVEKVSPFKSYWVIIRLVAKLCSAFSNPILEIKKKVNGVYVVKDIKNEFEVECEIIQLAQDAPEAEIYED